MTQRIQSDQFYNWSDIYEKKIDLLPSQTAQNAHRASTSSGRYPKRFTHRALQALWKTWVQVCQRPRARAEVLPLRYALEGQAANGLRATRSPLPGRQTSEKLPQPATNPRRNMRDQPRALATEGGAVGERCGNVDSVTQYRRTAGFGSLGSSSCQYARRLNQVRILEGGLTR
jgi:hypothetical protein